MPENAPVDELTEFFFSGKNEQGADSLLAHLKDGLDYDVDGCCLLSDRRTPDESPEISHLEG